MNILDDDFWYGNRGRVMSNKFCKKMECCMYENIVLKKDRDIVIRNFLGEEKRLTLVPQFETSKLVAMKDLWESIFHGAFFFDKCKCREIKLTIIQIL
jgi:hypothetical protein